MSWCSLKVTFQCYFFTSLATEIVAEEASVDKVFVCLFCGVCVVVVGTFFDF